MELILQEYPPPPPHPTYTPQKNSTSSDQACVTGLCPCLTRGPLFFPDHHLQCLSSSPNPGGATQPPPPLLFLLHPRLTALPLPGIHLGACPAAGGLGRFSERQGWNGVKKQSNKSKRALWCQETFSVTFGSCVCCCFFFLLPGFLFACLCF